jgi:hypothetical protein
MLTNQKIDFLDCYISLIIHRNQELLISSRLFETIIY